MSRLKEKYEKEILPRLMKENNYRSVMQAPRITKITLNMGLGESTSNAKVLEAALGDMTAIVGQKPVLTKARKSISNFKLRAGMTIGAKVTLRGDRMYEFVERLVGAALPRIRDFRGISPSGFDGRGNFSMGLREIEIFPEIEASVSGGSQGMDVTLVTSATDNRGARQLLAALGLPFASK